MIDQLNETVKNIESILISVPYEQVTITPDRGAEIEVHSEDFDKLRDEVDPILILTWPRNCEEYPVERSILIGTVRVFALYRE